MAVFIKIRNKFGLLISVVIFLALGLFVVQAAFNSNSSLLKGHSNNLGSVDGEAISAQDFNAELDKETDNYKQQNPKTNIDDQTTFSLRDQAWNTIVNNAINEREYDALGITLSDAEYKDMFQGNDPNPMVRQQFTDKQTGMFNPQSVANYIYNLNNAKPKTDDEAKQIETARQQWENFEQYVVQDQLQKKYKDLIKKAVYVPKWQAELAYSDRGDKATISYIVIPYYSVPDTSVKVTDQDLQNYVNANKEKYKQAEEARKIHFVTFSVIPSSDDTAQALKFINSTYSKLESNPNDTDFIRENADNPNDQVYYTKDKITSAKMKDTLFKIPVGSIIRPFFEDDSYKIIKLVDRQSLSDSVKAKHILFATAQDGSDSAKAYRQADSVFQLIKAKKVDFDSMAVKFSADKTSAEKGGDLGWIKQGQTVKPFNKFLFFGGKPGEMKLLKTQFGYHIVQIEEASPANTAVKLAYLSRKLEPSNATDKDIFNKANNFALKNNSDTLFNVAARGQRLQVLEADNLKHNDYNIPNLGVNRDLVKWAYTAKVGEVSPVISADSKYVVATLVSDNPKGVQSLSSIRAVVTTEVTKQKKAAVLIAKLIVPCELNVSLKYLADFTGQPVKKAQSLSMASQYVPGIGADGKLLGSVFGLKQGQLSAPIAGENAIYIVKVDTFEKSQPVADYSMIQQQLSMQLSGAIDYTLTDAIKKAMKVEDERYNFF